MREESPFFSFVVLAFNRKVELFKTIEHIIAAGSTESLPSFEIVVVDNGSSDGTFDSLMNDYGQTDFLKIVKLDKNIGISGWNNGAQIAKGSYLWFLDDDSYPLQESVLTAYKELANHQVVAAACRVHHQPGASGLVMDQHMNHKPINVFCGCGFILKGEVFRQLQGFWSGIFVYAHEKEFAVRLYDAGIKIIYLHDVIVQHDAAARLSDGKYFHTFRSTSLIYLRFLSFLSARIMILLYVVRNLPAIERNFYSASIKGVREAFALAGTDKLDRVRLGQAARKKYFFSLF